MNELAVEFWFGNGDYRFMKLDEEGATDPVETVKAVLVEAGVDPEGLRVRLNERIPGDESKSPWRIVWTWAEKVGYVRR
jgi:hypothetical protein